MKSARLRRALAILSGDFHPRADPYGHVLRRRAVCHHCQHELNGSACKTAQVDIDVSSEIRHTFPPIAPGYEGAALLVVQLELDVA